MKRHFLPLCFGATLCFGVNGIGLAATIYDETVSGDLDAVPTNLGNLLLGDSDVIGIFSATPPSDSDRFTVTLPAGLMIESITLTYGEIGNGEVLNTTLFTNGNLFDDGFTSPAAGLP